jgi:hypothetical protein
MVSTYAGARTLSVRVTHRGCVCRGTAKVMLVVVVSCVERQKVSKASQIARYGWIFRAAPCGSGADPTMFRDFSLLRPPTKKCGPHLSCPKFLGLPVRRPRDAPTGPTSFREKVNHTTDLAEILVKTSPSINGN